MIVYPCLGCGMPDLPIEELRCPKCGEENFIPLNRPLSAPEFSPALIHDTNIFCDASTEYIGKANTTMTDCRSNQYELMVKDISVSNEEHVDGFGRTYVEAERDEGAETINLRCQHFDLKQEQQSQINSIDPVLRNSALQEIPNAYDQAYAFNVEDNDVGVSASVNFSSYVSAHLEEPQNGMNSSRQPQSKWQNQSNFEVADDVDELSKFKNEDGEVDFSGCRKCYNKFLLDTSHLMHICRASVIRSSTNARDACVDLINLGCWIAIRLSTQKKSLLNVNNAVQVSRGDPNSRCMSADTCVSIWKNEFRLLISKDFF